jgi:hypothetical protein
MGLAGGDGLGLASDAAYSEGMAGLHWPGAPGARPVKPRLARSTATTCQKVTSTQGWHSGEKRSGQTVSCSQPWTPTSS